MPILSEKSRHANFCTGRGRYGNLTKGCPRCEWLMAQKEKRTATATAEQMFVAPPIDIDAYTAPLRHELRLWEHRLEDLEHHHELLVRRLDVWQETVNLDRAGLRRKLQVHETQVHRVTP